jgi:hypothetical protein
MKDAPLTIKTKDDEIIISIGLRTLAEVMKCSNYFQQILEENKFNEESIEVSDLKQFGKDVKEALEGEDEDGTTYVHEMFDYATQFICEQGFESVKINGE